MCVSFGVIDVLTTSMKKTFINNQQSLINFRGIKIANICKNQTTFHETDWRKRGLGKEKEKVRIEGEWEH